MRKIDEERRRKKGITIYDPSPGSGSEVAIDGCEAFELAANNWSMGYSRKQREPKIGRKEKKKKKKKGGRGWVS